MTIEPNETQYPLHTALPDATLVSAVVANTIPFVGVLAFDMLAL